MPLDLKTPPYPASLAASARVSMSLLMPLMALATPTAFAASSATQTQPAAVTKALTNTKNNSNESSQITALRTEMQAQIQALSAQYEQRIQQLEQQTRTQQKLEQKQEQLQSQQTAAAAPLSSSTDSSVSRLEPVSAGDTDSTAANSETATSATASKGFNPDISLILQGAYVHHPAQGATLPKGVLAPEQEAAGQGFTLDNTELVMSAAIDPYLQGYVNLAIAPEGKAEVEEAWFQTQALPYGIKIRAGRFLSGLGYGNGQHPHAWDFGDQNLIYQALFGEHLVQDGAQLSWLAPTDRYLELGAEISQGAGFPGSESAGAHREMPTRVLFAHTGGDINDSQSWRLGLSALTTHATDRESTLDDALGQMAKTRFTGKSQLWGIDGVWKWAPNGNASQRNAKLQAEYFQRKETGQLSCEDNSAQGGACTGASDAYQGTLSGWYVQGVYQFIPCWRLGYRYDQVSPDKTMLGSLPIAQTTEDARRHSLMLDFSPTEFSRFRLQVSQQQQANGHDDHPVVLQYMHSLGAHGAHTF